jgi:peptidoglycan/xylan/chitin deacetylase (PgdA/CDA1 family)
MLSSLASWAGAENKVRQEYRSMNTDEILILSNSEVIDIGAHTITHPILAALSAEEQFDEIVGSQKNLNPSLVGL